MGLVQNGMIERVVGVVKDMVPFLALKLRF